MRDPKLDMEQSTAMRQQATNGQSDQPRRNHHKSARVAFGPDLETYIPPRDKSPAPPSGHQRSFTTVEHKPSLSTSGRPTSSSSGDNPVGPEPLIRVPSDRASDSGRPSMLKRAKSDYGPRLGFDKAPAGDDEEDFAMRHGWQEEFTSSEYLKALHSVSRICVMRYISYVLTPNPGAVRISTCILRKNAMRRMASQGIRLEAGQPRIGG